PERRSIMAAKSCRPAAPEPFWKSLFPSTRRCAAHPVARSYSWRQSSPVPAFAPHWRLLPLPVPANFPPPAWSEAPSIATLSSLFSLHSLELGPVHIHLLYFIQQRLVADL